jgi:circadian clock protein KaiC
MEKKGKNKIEIKRYSTGISGFDSLCEGGFANNSINLIAGNAGAGKTTFLLQFLYNGATKYEENGLYVSFEPEVKDLYIAGKKQGMDFEQLDKKDSCKIIKIDPNLQIGKIQKTITQIILDYAISRVCLDPINLLSMSLGENGNIRKNLYEFLSLLKKLGVCVLISGEYDSTDHKEVSKDGGIEFCSYLTDSFVELFSSGLGSKGDRALRITKMRMTNHFRGPVGFEINDTGIKVFPNKL